jgi:hypothetical protein
MSLSLDILPKFDIETVELLPSGANLVCGQLEPGPYSLENLSWFWLWPTEDTFILPQTDSVDVASGRVCVRIEAPEMSSEIRKGARLPWHTPIWQAYHIRMIREGLWQTVQFEAADAMHFDLNGVHGWTRVESEIPEGATATGVQAKGWDHEHCDICMERIGVSGFPIGYVSPDEHWLCPPCYDQWGSRRDLGFLVDKGE